MASVLLCPPRQRPATSVTTSQQQQEQRIQLQHGVVLCPCCLCAPRQVQAADTSGTALSVSRREEVSLNTSWYGSHSCTASLDPITCMPP